MAPVTKDATFEEAVSLCERRLHGHDASLAASVPGLLRQVFDSDFNLLRQSGTKRSAHAVPCAKPAEGMDGYGLADEELLRMVTEPGRACQGGTCCSACSRIIFDCFATAAECDALRQRASALMRPTTHNLYLDRCAELMDVRTTLLFIRLVERMRRAVAFEYRLRLDSVSPKLVFVSRLSTEASGYTDLHADESTSSAFHYSSIIYLSTGGEDFDGGDFVFSDAASGPQSVGRAAGESPPGEGEPRRLTRLPPIRGRALVFSSGWENLHFVDRVLSGTRVALPAVFTTHPPRLEYGLTFRTMDDDERTEAVWRHITRDDSAQLMSRWHALLVSPSRAERRGFASRAILMPMRHALHVMGRQLRALRRGPSRADPFIPCTC